jgi:hypothetical protein
MALYVMAYTAGRGWIEMLRIDNVEYQHVLGLRLNVWTSIVMFCLATAYFVVVGRRRPGREVEVYKEKRLARDRAAAQAAGTPDLADSKCEDVPEAELEPAEAESSRPAPDGEAERGSPPSSA